MPNTPGDKPSKNERREAAREKARLQREEAKKKARRKRIILQSSIVIAAVAIVAIVAVIVVNSVRPATSAAGPENMISDGIVIGENLEAVRTAALAAGATPSVAPVASDETHLTLYLDYQCPYCQAFEQTNSAQIAEWVSSGEVTLEIRPVRFLDDMGGSTNQYSTRAAAAAACVANYAPDSFYAFNTAMFDNQPSEGGAGPSNSDIAALVTSVTGTEVPELTECIMDGTFMDWAKAADYRAFNEPNESGSAISGTPTVLLNGTVVEGSLSTDASVLADAVAAVKANG